MHFLIEYALSFIGLPYRWGGECPFSGFDCSGLVQEILRSVGMDPIGDQSAQALYKHFSTNAEVQVGPGALVFYGKDLDQIIHVAFMIDHMRVIEAGGGNKNVINYGMAEKYNAFVRIRPYKYRSDCLITLMPKYGF